ncbi:MAG: DUF3040 domain-containing protein [Streptomycetales bacterium]
MPLSEHEQRMLEQMERALYAEDPKFASALRGADARARFRRRAYLAVGGFVMGVILLMTGVIMQVIPVSIVGFLVMLGCALLAVSSWRRIPAPGEVAAAASSGPRPRRSKTRRGFMERVEERWRRRRDGHGR